MRWSFDSSGAPPRICDLCAAPEDGNHTLLACLRGRRWTVRVARRLADALAAISKAVGQ
jgi:hypothetical protein